MPNYYFENVNDTGYGYSMNTIYVAKVLNDDGKYMYVIEAYLYHFGIDNRKVKIEKWKYLYPNYHFYVANSDKNSYIAKFFENVYKNVDVKSIIRE